MVSLLPGPGYGGHAAGGPDPLVQPEFFEGVILKRVLAYMVDAVLSGLLLAAAYVAMLVAGLLTLGLAMPFLPLVAVFIPLAYLVLPIASRHQATPGMRLFGIRVETFQGPRPTLFQAFLRTALFFVILAATGSLALLVVPFNARRLALHDLLSGTMVLNRVETA
ncbi:MAG: RDD family protein [Alphaproteobacteria bacterium]|nr:RDD family protein [Alphaproteobacteria bacterium]